MPAAKRDEWRGVSAFVRLCRGFGAAAMTRCMKASGRRKTKGMEMDAAVMMAEQLGDDLPRCLVAGPIGGRSQAARLEMVRIITKPARVPVRRRKHAIKSRPTTVKPRSVSH